MKSRVSIVGCGNIGGALARRLFLADVSLSLWDTDSEKLKALSAHLGISVSSTMSGALSSSAIVILSVKPPVLIELLGQIKEELAEKLAEVTIVSVAAGVSIAEMRSVLGGEQKLARAMPNLAMAFGEGMTGVFSEDQNTANLVDQLFSLVGQSLKLSEESLIAVATGVAGSGPAFICQAINGLKLAGQKLGLTAEQAEIMAAQTALGAAKMIIDGKESPTSIIKRVTTPGGTTAQGLAVLESKQFEQIMVEAVEAASKRACQPMSKS